MARKTTSTKKSTPRKAATSPARREAPIAKQQKPIFSSATLITVLLAVLLGLYAFYLNREKTNEAEATPTGEETAFVFDVPGSDIKSIEIKPADGEAVKVTRNAENIWAMELPIEAEANQGLAEGAASQVTALQVIAEVEGDPENFGLDDPVYVFSVEYADGKTHTLEVGDITITNNGYYVRVDKDKMMITSLSGIDSLLNLVNFPPYLNTPTPRRPDRDPIPPLRYRPLINCNFNTLRFIQVKPTAVRTLNEPGQP
jgi:hypothetical protein